ncbi:MAG: ankyrin repeat domain-containing protein [Actinomycetota bacterium]
MTILDDIEAGDLGAVRAALAAGFVPDTPVGDDGDLALCWAAAYGQVDIVHALLEHGASIDLAPAHGMGGPALADALFENQVETARVLVAAGASVGFAAAAALGMLEVVQAHDETHSERWSAFLSACKTGEIEVVRHLVPRGIDVAIYPPGDEWGGVGASGLHWAAAGNHTELVRYLLEVGTPVDIVDDTFANTPLGWAVMDGAEDAATALRAAGADESLVRA